MSPTEPIPQDDKVYLDTPYLYVRWERSASWVHVEWKAWATSSEFRTAYDAILEAVGENRASKLLIDLRKTRVLADEDQRWLLDDWGPRSVQAGVRSMAVVVPERPLAKLILENMDKRIPSSVLEIRSFGTLEEAARWLSP
jgi:hypothetical protein